ncbi:MAG: hypothetical protein J0M15_05510 [Deltaproteobacteria bacterium]|nr:hypothetical protein [Deltaproteobacteria bacterium]
MILPLHIGSEISLKDFSFSLLIRMLFNETSASQKLAAVMDFYLDGSVFAEEYKKIMS